MFTATIFGRSPDIFAKYRPPRRKAAPAVMLDTDPALRKTIVLCSSVYFASLAPLRLELLLRVPGRLRHAPKAGFWKVYALCSVHLPPGMSQSSNNEGKDIEKGGSPARHVALAKRGA